MTSAAPMPSAKRTAVTARYAASEPVACNPHAIGHATSVPNVPGATGERPAPSPSARKCAGRTNRNDTGTAGCDMGWELSAARRFRRRRRGNDRTRGAAAPVALPPSSCTTSALPATMRPMRVTATPAGARRRADGVAARGSRGEAELVVVAAGEQARQRRVALGGSQLGVERGATGQRGELDDGADAAALEEMTEVAGEAIGHVDRRRRDTAQRLPERHARRRRVEARAQARQAPAVRARCGLRSPPTPASRRRACRRHRRRPPPALRRDAGQFPPARRPAASGRDCADRAWCRRRRHRRRALPPARTGHARTPSARPHRRRAAPPPAAQSAGARPSPRCPTG